MKGIFLFSILIFCISNTKGQSQTINDFKKLAWLEGTWNRINAKPGRTGNESWTRISGTELQGLGLTMKGGDTVSIEKLKLVIKDENIFYVADVPENKGPVYFRITEISETSFSRKRSLNFFKKIIDRSPITGNSCL